MTITCGFVWAGAGRIHAFNPADCGTFDALFGGTPDSHAAAGLNAIKGHYQADSHVLITDRDIDMAIPDVGDWDLDRKKAAHFKIFATTLASKLIDQANHVVWFYFSEEGPAIRTPIVSRGDLSHFQMRFDDITPWSLCYLPFKANVYRRDNTTPVLFEFGNLID